MVYLSPLHLVQVSTNTALLIHNVTAALYQIAFTLH